MAIIATERVTSLFSVPEQDSSKAPELNSLSSTLMMYTTLIHNSFNDGPATGSLEMFYPICGKVISLFGYALVVIVSSIETIVALAASALSLLAYPVSSTPLKHATKWLESSAFCIGWSVVDFFRNFFVETLVADEESARTMWRSGDFKTLPEGAIQSHDELIFALYN